MPRPRSPVDRTLAILTSILILPPVAMLFAAPGGPKAGSRSAHAPKVADPHAGHNHPPPPPATMGPLPPPGFFGSLPDPYPGPDAAEGVKRLALVYTGCTVGETEPCG